METINLVLAVLLAIPVALAVCFAIYRSRTRQRTRQLELELARSEGADGIGSRVRVLERIVTDKGIAVAAQIEALREESDGPLGGRKGI